MVDFKNLKKNRSDAMEKLNKKLNEMNKNNSFYREEDEILWKVSKDTNGNGFAVIRFFFLPQDDTNEMPYVTRFEHGFKGVGGFYYENNRNTIGEDDPVTEYNSKLWQSDIPENKEKARIQKRKKYYFANILVIKDPENPKNEGKVFVYKFGQKIMDKIIEMQKPSFDGDEPIDPFDLWEGLNFRLSVSEVAGFPNYDKSKFDTRQTPIAEDDEAIEAIWKQRHDLSKFIDKSAFKSYDELKAKLEKVLGIGSSTRQNSSFSSFDDEEKEEKSMFDMSDEEEKQTSKKSSQSKSIKEAFVDEEDDDLKFFNSLKED